MAKSLRINKLIYDKLYSKDIDPDLKDLIWKLLMFENESYDEKYSAQYERLFEIYLRRKQKI